MAASVGKVLALAVCAFLLLRLEGRGAGEYVIGPEDTLHIQVWGNEQLNRTVPVRPDGKISFPLLDDIQASGLTPLQLKEAIAQRLTEFMSDPQVTVIVAGINSPRIFVQGEVANPGIQLMRRELTLLELIAMVGGVTRNADLKRAYLLRNGAKLPLDFYKLVVEGDLAHNVPLATNDLIFIPDNFESRITVVGEVQTPQTLVFRDGLTVLDAILQTGGFTPFARRNDTVVMRQNGDQQEKLTVRMNDVLKKGMIERNLTLKPGDTIIVPKSLF